MKEELRKEFLTKESDTDYLPGYQKSNALFDWFYYKLEAKDKEIEEFKIDRTNALSLCELMKKESIRKGLMIVDLKAKLEAAEKALKILIP